MGFKTDIQIAQECDKKKITEIAKTAGVLLQFLFRRSTERCCC